jgi:alkylation response protein AidB-like acyl-CoA dehydrogenase
VNYSWTEEQLQLRRSLERFAAANNGFAARRAGKPDWRARAWQELAELGILGLPFAEVHGGSGGSPLDIYLVMEALGQELVALPFVSNIVLSGALLQGAASAAQQARLIPPLLRGEASYASGFAEPQSRYNLADVSLRAAREGSGFILNGRKSVVYGGPQANAIIVTARTAGGQREAAGISLFLVPSGTPGLTRRDYDTVDGFTASELFADNLSVGADALIGPLDGALPIIEKAVDAAAAAICAEAVGIMAALNARCVDYAKTRVAFGQTLSKFQIIQHRLVDMRVSYEHAAAISLRAALAVEREPRTRTRAVSAAKVLVAEEAGFVGKNAVQLHGAIGMTDELDVGHYFRRLMIIRSLFGSGDHHLRRYIATGRGEA